MSKTVYIVIVSAILTSCGRVLFKTFSFPEEPISFRKVGYEDRLAMDTITKQVYRDKVFVDTIVSFQGSPYTKYKFNLNEKCFYSFMGNGSDSGPIYWQYKGSYKVRNDSILINFYEYRSIGYNSVHFSGMKIEDRPWKKGDMLGSRTFLLGEKRDTIWGIQKSGLKSSYLIKR